MMRFGSKNALATFQEAVHVVLATVKVQYTLVCIDDNIVVFKTPKDRLQHTKEALSLQNHAGTTIRLKNSFFFSETVDYLGHVIATGKFQVDT